MAGSNTVSNEEKMLDPQRAVRRVEISARTLALAAILLTGSEWALLSGVNAIFAFWNRVLIFGMALAAADGQVVMEDWVIRPRHGVMMPGLDLPALPPDGAHYWWVAYAVCMIWLLVSYLPERMLPLSYGARFLCFVQASSLVFFALKPASYVYGISHFARTELNAGFVFMLLVPVLLSVSYFTLGFSSFKKASLLALTLGFFAVAVPLHVLACSVLAQKLTLVVLPVFYLAMGPLIFVAWFVAFYSWGLSWER
jgi:hypothetical protein